MQSIPINSSIPTTYKANWPKNMDPALKSTCSKVINFFWNSLSWIIFPIGLMRLGLTLVKHFVWSYVIPGSLEIDTEAAGKKLLEAYKGTRVNITSADGAKLEGAFFPGEKNPRKAIIYAFGNAMQWETSDRMIKLFKPFSTSILCVNPRGVGNSKGLRYEEGYALDIYSAYKYLIDQHGIKPEDILLVGFSMGGGYGSCGAALVQEEYPTQKLPAINICSFKDLGSELNHLLPNMHSYFMRFGRILTSLLGIDLKAKPCWETLKGDKCLFYCPSDSIIPYEVSLFDAIQSNPQSKTTVVRMREELNLTFISHNRSFFSEEGTEFFMQMLNMLRLKYEDTQFDKTWIFTQNGLRKTLQDQFEKIVRSPTYPPPDFLPLEIQVIQPAKLA